MTIECVREMGFIAINIEVITLIFIFLMRNSLSCVKFNRVYY